MFCDSVINFRVLVPCNHSDLCLKCYLRNEICYQNHHCGYCTKDFVTAPIATTDMNLTYEQARKKDLLHNDSFHLSFFQKCVMSEIAKYMKFACSQCNSVFTQQTPFIDHLRKHNMKVCYNCINSHRFLPCEAVCYGADELNQHLKHHPKCPCCRFDAFDAHQLELHMTEKHIRCDLCLRRYNKVVWLKNEKELIQHNSREHFVCHYPSCFDTPIAFPTQYELLRHLQDEHHEIVSMDGVVIEDRVPDIDRNEKNARTRELNQKFMHKLVEVFGADADKIGQLKDIASSLRQNKITVQQFYKFFSQLTGEHKNKLFTDMVALLPDPKKRAELLRLNENIDLKPSRSRPPVQPHMSKSISMPIVSNQDLQSSTQSPITSNPSPPQPAVEQVTPQNPPNRPQQQRKKKSRPIVISSF